MWKRAFAAVAVLLCLAGIGAAQDASSVVSDVARNIGAAGLNSIQYSGTGSIFPYGQSYLPGGSYPRFNLNSYSQQMDYQNGAFREENVRTYLNPPERGGSAVFVGELRQVALLSGNYAWNLNAAGAPVPAVADAPLRRLQIALTPHGWVKAAMAARPAMKTSSLNGKPVRVISFTADGKYTVNGYVNAQNLLEKTETWIADPVLGDVLVEASYSDYRDFSGVKFPGKIVQKQGGFPILDLTVNEVQPNAAVNLEVPQGVRDFVPPPMRVESQKVAEGIWLLGGFSHASALVEFKDYVAVLDAPFSEERSLAVMAEVKKLVPSKPIRYLVNTHHHFDHTGGLRTYVAEGVTIITNQINKPYYEKNFRAPHTLAPDRLSQNPKAAKIITVTDRYVMTDGVRTVELHLLRDNPHNPGMLFAYMPKEKLLYQADSFTPPRPTAMPPAVNSVNTRNLNLQANIERLHLDVEQILGAHGGILQIGEFRKAIAKGD